MEPTQEQLRVIWAGYGPKMVLALAGCAKTTSLLWRIRRLIEGARAPDGRLLELGTPPDRILLTTFSKRGASDMERRAALLRVPRGVQYRTLHSVGFEMVRSNVIDRRPIVPARWQVRRVIREELARIKKELGGQCESLPKVKEVLHEIGLAKAALIWPDLPGIPGAWTAAHGVTFPGFQTWAVSRDRAPLEEGLADVISRCYAALESAARAPESYGAESEREPPFRRDAGARWITFDDQLALPARAILRRGQRDDWVYPWYGSFWHVLCDEVQDNNLAQWVLIEWLARNRNLVVVGDENQAIFRWRGSDPYLMREFLNRHLDAEVLTLSFNFRSGIEILDLANKVLENCPERIHDFKLRSGFPMEVRAKVTVQPVGAPEEEARFVIGEIETAIRDGQNPDEIAVLYRINSQSGPLELECIRRGLPYKIAGSSFFSRGEIKAAIGYLACALDETDVDGLKDCCNAPTRYLGNEFLDANPTLAKARENMALNQLGTWRRRVEDLFRVIGHVRSRLERADVAVTLRYIFETVGVRRHFREEGTEEEDETEVDEACAALIHCAGAMSNARELISYARSMTKTGFEEFDGERESALPRITLSTVHKAKGLEWESVFIVGCNGGLFPLGQAIEEEERCLFYVACSRAKKRVTLSYFTVGSSGKPTGPSRFLFEVGLVTREESLKAAATLANDEPLLDDPETEPEAPKVVAPEELAAFLEERRPDFDAEAASF